MVKVLQRNGDDIKIFDIVELEKETWGKIKVKMPVNETSLSWEKTILDNLKQELDNVQIKYNNQLEFVSELESL